MEIEKISKVVGVFAVVVPIAWGIFTYSINLENERRSFSFKNYHDIVAEIYAGGRQEFNGSQRALIYELTRFPEYGEFSCREFERMKRQLDNKDTLEEIDLALKKLNCSG